MTLQALKYFVTVARLKSYSRAAAECFVSQPALSRAVSALEKELGCRLFDRSTRTVTLTLQGEACLREAEEILASCDRLRVCASGKEEYQLRVGYMLNGYLYELNRRLAAMPEKISLETRYDTFPRLRQRLLAGELDAVLIPEVEQKDVAGTEFSYLIRSCLYVIFPAGHELEGRDRVYFSDLKELKFIGWNEEDLPGINAFHRAACRRHGFEPAYAAFARKAGDAVVLARQYNAVVLLASTIASTVPEGFWAKPVEDSEKNYGIVCAWRKENRNPVLEILRRLNTED